MNATNAPAASASFAPSLPSGRVSRGAGPEIDERTVAPGGSGSGGAVSREVFESLASGVVVQGPSGAIVDANPAACLILGLIFAYIAIFFRRLNKQLRRDRLSEYRLPPEAMPQSRPCPKWMNRATGRAEVA